MINDSNNNYKFHEIRIGEGFNGFVVGIMPPVKKIQNKLISTVIAEALNIDLLELQSSTVFSEKTYNEWLIGDVAEDSVRSIVRDIIKKVGDNETKFRFISGEIYPASYSTLFDD
ncbi:MAG: hypothetical protein WCI37_01825 [bacterium]